MHEFIPPATRFALLPERFAMKRGGVLHGARVGYETFGQPSAAGDNVVLLLTGLSPDAHAASSPEDPAPGWWESMLGPGKPIDTDQWHVICVNSLGGCQGSTGPASPDPATGQPYRLGFPELSIEDIADAAANTVRHLGFERLACVVGASMGGMSALALLARHPELARSHLSISAAAYSLPYSIAIRSVQREAIRSDPLWNDGQYLPERYPERGMLTARKIGMTTYRSAREWERRFGRERSGIGGAAFGPEFAVEFYLDHHARRFVRRFDPNSYLYLSRSMDWFDLGELCDGGTDEALARLRVDQALVIGTETDILFPLHQQRQIADGLRAGGADVEFLALESDLGHDAFLADLDSFGPPVAKFLSTL